MKRIVIVGGGYAGTMLARSLDQVAEVRLIEPRDRFVHNVAAIRAIVEPALLDQLVIPYDRLLRRGAVIQGEVVAIDDRQVTLADGRTVEGDIIVAATGSSYARPFKPQSASAAAFAADSRAAHKALLAARRVAIIGGGAVGVELAGEIAAAHPDKKVVLLAASAGLLPGYSERLSSALVNQLNARGVTVRLGARADAFPSLDGPFAGPLRVQGRRVEVDLVFPALGARPTPPPIAQAALASSGRLVVDPWLRAPGRGAVFALGDAAETGEPMTIIAITRQAPWLAKALKMILDGRPVESIAPYARRSVPAILVPLGAKAGASVLPVTRRGLTVGSCATSAIKGRDLFIPRYRKEFGYSAASGSHRVQEGFRA